MAHELISVSHLYMGMPTRSMGAVWHAQYGGLVGDSSAIFSSTVSMPSRLSARSSCDSLVLQYGSA